MASSVVYYSKQDDENKIRKIARPTRSPRVSLLFLPRDSHERRGKERGSGNEAVARLDGSCGATSPEIQTECFLQLWDLVKCSEKGLNLNLSDFFSLHLQVKISLNVWLRRAFEIYSISISNTLVLHDYSKPSF